MYTSRESSAVPSAMASRASPAAPSYTSAHAKSCIMSIASSIRQTSIIPPPFDTSSFHLHSSIHNYRAITPALSSISFDDINNGFGGGNKDDFDNEKDGSSNTGGNDVRDAPKDTKLEIISEEIYEEAQKGCVERRPWSWSLVKSKGLYKPIRQGK
ncbi:hypothetical protein OCU04_012666 [Sclerotinia nivalis]|uniref:Uncharacterized protein n=1 Tax=Sclerotinia nivalis TaxID=352851 RepID=A0A9X0AAA5_9HELO|nr:hypothetical protein OCU04_012666 [Sclerotinia nivalis]